MASKSTAAAAGNALWNKIPKANAELFALTYGALVTELLRDYGENDIDQINEQLDKMGHSIGMRCVDEFMAKSYNYMTADSGSSGSGGTGVSGSGKSGTGSGTSSGASIMACRNFMDTAEVLAKTAFKMFLGIAAEVVVSPPTVNKSTAQNQSQSLQSTNAQQSSSFEQQLDDNGDPTASSTMNSKTGADSKASAAPQSFSLLFYDNPLATFVELPQNLKDKLEYSIIYCGVIRGALEMLNMRVKCKFARSTLKGDECNEIRVELQEVVADGAGDDYGDE